MHKISANILNPLFIILLQVDKDGMRPDKLQQALETCPKDHMPKVMYINPTGANPCGNVIPHRRREEIYRICSNFDLLILEDDPYYFLQFGDTRVPSFFSMDVDGRVIRFDSFSKILSSGLRLGFATGPKPLIDRIMLHMQVSVMHTSALPQIILSQLLDKWGLEGFFKHVKNIEDFYRERRDVTQVAAQKHLTGICEWNLPGILYFY